MASGHDIEESISVIPITVIKRFLLHATVEIKEISDRILLFLRLQYDKATSLNVRFFQSLEHRCLFGDYRQIAQCRECYTIDMDDRGWEGSMRGSTAIQYEMFVRSLIPDSLPLLNHS